MSLKDEILAKYAPKPEPVDGLGVWAKALSGADWFDLMACESSSDRYVLAVVRGACDESGARIFADEDTAKVRGLTRDFCGPVSDAVLRLSGVVTEGKAESTPAGGSPSGSP